MTTKKNTFKPGQSGNPNGRPRGSGEVGKLRASIAASVPDILATLVGLAAAGDVGAARLLLERVLPPLKPEEIPVRIQLPPDGLASQGRAILRAVADGTLAPGQGTALLTGLGSLARVIEIAELEERIVILESRK